MRNMVWSLVVASACASPAAASRSAPWVAMIGVENQTLDPGPLPGGRDVWLSTSPRLVVEASSRIAVPFTADSASVTALDLDGFFDATTGGSMYLQAQVASEAAAATTGMTYGALVRVTVANEGSMTSSLLGADSVLVYVSIPDEGPCESTAVAHASELDYRLVSERGGASLGSFVTTDQTLRIGPVAIRFVVPDESCGAPDRG